MAIYAATIFSSMVFSFYDRNRGTFHVCLFSRGLTEMMKPIKGNWPEIAETDLRVMQMKMKIGEAHPGLIDLTNNEFRDWYQFGFEDAMRLAPMASS